MDTKPGGSLTLPNARLPIEINIRVRHNVTSNYKVFFFFCNFLFWLLFVLDIPS